MGKKIGFSIMFWVISCTWGIILTVIGLLVTGIATLLGGTPHKNGCSYIVEVGGNWGGLSIGPVALCGRYTTRPKEWYYSPSFFDKTRKHEFGHSIQHLVFGPFYIFAIGLISAGRYWYKTIAQEKGKSFSSDWYEEGFWAEKNATVNGTKHVEWLEGENNEH